MSNRNLSTTQITANNQQSVRFFELLFVRTRRTGSEEYDYSYLSNAPYNVEVTSAQSASMKLPAGSHEFLALGEFLQFSSIEETMDFQITTMTVSLGGMLPTDLAFFMNNQYVDQPLMIYRVWFDTDGLMIGDPVLIFEGRIDKPVVSDDPGGAVVVGCSASSQWVDYERTNGRHTNNSEQRNFDLTYYNRAATTANIDTGFKFAADTITDLKWGG